MMWNKKTMADSALRRQKSTDFESSCHSKDREGSHCRLCALIATSTRLKTTSGGSLQDTERSSATGGGQFKLKAPNRILVI